MPKKRKSKYPLGAYIDVPLLPDPSVNDGELVAVFRDGHTTNVLYCADGVKSLAAALRKLDNGTHGDVVSFRGNEATCKDFRAHIRG